jgi:hypothetical protein
VNAFRTTLRSLLVLALSAALPAAALAATPITGTVINRTNGKPAAGDTVVLLRLAQGMQEIAHTTTDAHGHYSLDAPTDGLHLVRVTHDSTTYFSPAEPGAATVDVDVYSAAPHVKGVSTEAIVMRLQTDAGGTSIRVIENFFLKNDSKPAMTQFSNEPFDFYLPAGAVIEGAAALAPGGNPLKVAPVPLPEQGKYTFLFPIRPGETRFQVSYHVPYSGSFSFADKVAGPTGTVALMMPKSIQFTPAAGTPFNAVNDDVNAQTFVAQNVTPDQPLGFTLAGKGELPRDTQNPATGAETSGGPATNSTGNVAATDNTAPGKGLDNPLDPNGSREPVDLGWARFKWWYLGGFALLLAAAAGILLRKPTTPSTVVAMQEHLPSPQTQHDRLLQALKEEMFVLETDRLQDRITETDYTEQKSALELILRRALSRSNG